MLFTKIYYIFFHNIWYYLSEINNFIYLKDILKLKYQIFLSFLLLLKMKNITLLFHFKI
jgi:hypothetical protein